MLGNLPSRDAVRAGGEPGATGDPRRRLRGERPGGQRLPRHPRGARPARPRVQANARWLRGAGGPPDALLRPLPAATAHPGAGQFLRVRTVTLGELVTRLEALAVDAEAMQAQAPAAAVIKLVLAELRAVNGSATPPPPPHSDSPEP